MKVLIAEDDAISRRLLEATLLKWGYQVELAQDGEEAFAALQQRDAPQLAILDWMMPGIDGVEVCRRIRRQTTETPTYIILLTAKGNKEDVVAGLESGADDYLTKPFERLELKARIEVGKRVVDLQKKLAERVRELDQTLTELKQAEIEVRNLSMTDDLTGLYNRRGFLVLTEQQQKIARRNKNPFSLIYADMDGLKQINDIYGHHRGSQAIGEIAKILRESFRESDIIARLGGDEFTIFVEDSISWDTEIPVNRLRENLRRYNGQKLQPYELSLSIGVICVMPEDNSSIEELLIKADQVMYKNKKQKRELSLS